MPKFHQVNVLGKIVGYEPMTLTSPTYGLRDQNVTRAWLQWYTSCNVAPRPPIDCRFFLHKFSLFN